MKRLTLYTLVLALAVSRMALGCGCYIDDELQEAAELAATNKPEAAEAIKTLRAAGPNGLMALNFTHRATIRAFTAADAAAQPKDAAAVAKWAFLKTAFDEVAGQRGHLNSHLYWYTDLEAAKQAAKASGKPIVSLRMLGKLTDEFSCANSRFFRSTLYSNAEVSAALRSGFILHWESVRPVPKVTIDMGDGRKLERTLTGNSIHWILDHEGRTVDALPGLYGPKAFLEHLKAAGTAARESAAKTVETERVAYLKQWHQAKHQDTEEIIRDNLNRLGLPADAITGRSAGVRTVATAQVPAAPTAAEAALEAPGPKMSVEASMLRAISPNVTIDPSKFTSEVWTRLAHLRRDDAELDQASVAVIRAENPTAAQAGELAVTKSLVEDPLVRLVRNLKQSIALDTVRNEFLFHQQIRKWFISGEALVDVKRINERVYAELFLTPSSDPWLGLAPRDTYSALENGGVVRE